MFFGNLGALGNSCAFNRGMLAFLDDKGSLMWEASFFEPGSFTN